MHDRHTDAVIFEMIAKLLDIVASKWRVQLLSIPTDGALNVNGIHQGVVTFQCEAALENFYRI